MSGLKSVLGSASGDAPAFVLAGNWNAAFEGSSASATLTMVILDNAGSSYYWAQPLPDVVVVDDIQDDINAGLAALDEPVVETWESVKERLGL